MGALLRQLLDVCFLRRGPQDLPYSPGAVGVAFVGLLAAQALTGVSTGATAPPIVARLGVTLLLLAGATPWLLRARGFGNRVAQTLLAQAGAGLFFTLAMLPVTLALLPHVAATQTDTPPPPEALVPALGALVLFLWKLRVDASIWAHALDLRRPQSLLLAVAFVIAELFLLVLFSPPVPRGVAT